MQFLRWSREVPTTHNFLLAGASIPCLEDVRQFLGDFPEKFAEGYRSVEVKVQSKYS